MSGLYTKTVLNHVFAQAQSSLNLLLTTLSYSIMRLVILMLLLCCQQVLGQAINGTVYNAGNQKPVEFVNIGIPGKNIGTVSDPTGHFQLAISNEFDNDTLVFSCIGFQAYKVKVSDLKMAKTQNVQLHEKTTQLTEVLIKPRKFAERRLGVTAKGTKMTAGFKDNNLGYECGIMMHNRKTAFLKEVNVNIAQSLYDSIHYRLNVYRIGKGKTFENVLDSPIYVKLGKSEIKDKISINLEHLNLVLEGDFLVTLEHIKELGPGGLYFSTGLSHKTYYRKTSQGAWQTVPIGLSISVLADVEK